jgi:hypothetical protein
VQKDPGQTFQVPLRRIAVSPSASPAPPGGNATEWTIADDVYEGMIRTVLRFTHALERRPSSAELLIANEETMRDWLMFLPSATYETPDGRDPFIGGETENGAGKTDILVRYEDRNVFIGECKFWHGQKKLSEAIDQLLSYTVWRDTSGWHSQCHAHEPVAIPEPVGRVLDTHVGHPGNRARRGGHVGADGDAVEAHRVVEQEGRDDRTVFGNVDVIDHAEVAEREPSAVGAAARIDHPAHLLKDTADESSVRVT